jgi:hypothetical protein
MPRRKDGRPRRWNSMPTLSMRRNRPVSTSRGRLVTSRCLIRPSRTPRYQWVPSHTSKLSSRSLILFGA